jgi:hypothetical protein
MTKSSRTRMENLVVEVLSKMQTVTNWQRELKEWTTKEAFTYFRNTRTNLEKKLSNIFGHGSFFCVIPRFSSKLVFFLLSDDNNLNDTSYLCLHLCFENYHLTFWALYCCFCVKRKKIIFRYKIVVPVTSY